jgi:TRAP-type C4-dicarboxylate transport system permease small subunit
METIKRSEIGFIRWMDRLSVWAGYLGTVFLFLITLTIICDAFMRSFFNQPLRFGPDLLGFLAIYSILLPCAMALKNNRQVDVSVFFSRFPPRIKRIVTFITFILALIVFSITTVYAFQLTMDSFIGKLKSNSPFGMKLWYSQFGDFIGMALLSLQIIAKLTREVFYPASGREG